MDRHETGSERGDEFSGADWRVFGVLELPITPGSDRLIAGWLVKSLGSLNLRQTFLDKVVRSAGGVAKRAAQAAGLALFERILLHIYIPEQYAVNKKTLVGKPPDIRAWGFFQTEKIERAMFERPPVGKPPDSKHAANLVIALYLYPEG